MKALLIAAVASIGVHNATAADAPSAEHGRQVFAYWCAPCHGAGPGHPGTSALAAKYQGTLPAELEKRRNLTPELINTVVRHGISIMPIFRKTEVSDADLAAIRVYLLSPKK